MGIFCIFTELNIWSVYFTAYKLYLMKKIQLLREKKKSLGGQPDNQMEDRFQVNLG